MARKGNRTLPSLPENRLHPSLQISTQERGEEKENSTSKWCRWNKMMEMEEPNLVIHYLGWTTTSS
jgi:hypothetical protein